jgi:monovalent cation/hydrogen antiporter
MRRCSGCATCTSTASAASRPGAGKIEDDGYEDQSLAYQQMVQLVLRAQREALLRLRSDRKLSNEVMNRIMHELDLEESRLEI